MTKTSKIILWVITAIIVIGGIWYGVSKKPTSTPTTKEPIKIGVILPLTGPGVHIGESENNGIQMALEKLKIKGYNIDLIIEDDQTNPAHTLNAYYKLTQADKVKYILSGGSSASSLAIAPVAEEQRIIVLSFSATAPSLTKNRKFIFRNQSFTNQEDDRLFEFVKSKNKTNVALVYLQDNDFSVERKKYIEKDLLPKLGMNLRKAFGVSSSETDFRIILKKIKKLISGDEIDVVMFDVIGQGAVSILRQTKELGLLDEIKNKDILVLGNKVLNMADIKERVREIDLGLKIYFAEAEFSRETNSDFWDDYLKRFNKEPDIFAAQAYESLILVTELVSSCKNLKEEIVCVQQKLSNLKNWPGVTGNLTMDKGNNVLKTITIKAVD